MLRMYVYMHSRFVENHPIRILEYGPLISEGVLSQSSWLRIGNRAIGIMTVSTRQLSHKEVSATWAVCSMVSSSSTPMTVVIHGSVGLRGITTLTSHLSWPWAIDMRSR
jgi:hypothetical protein